MGRRGSLIAVAMLAATLVHGAPQGDEPAGGFSSALERMESLVGTWRIARATLRGEDYEDARTVVYRLTGDGTALVESFRGESSMTSVYHMDGDDLRLTHYRSAGNQPRMKAESWDPERGLLRFGFVDVSNLAAPDAYHTRELEVVFQDADHVQLRFEGLKAGVPVPAWMWLERTGPPPVPPAREGAALPLPGSSAKRAAEGSSLDGAFERLKALAGAWEVVGSPGKTVVYEVTGRGSAVMETFLGGRGMASVYHRDGESLMMTHYCSAGNQPRMRVAAWDPGTGVLEFDFLDVTNVADPDAYYTRTLRIAFRDDDHVELDFNGLGHGEEFPVSHSLRRLSPSER